MCFLVLSFPLEDSLYLKPSLTDIRVAILAGFVQAAQAVGAFHLLLAGGVAYLAFNAAFYWLPEQLDELNTALKIIEFKGG